MRVKIIAFAVALFTVLGIAKVFAEVKAAQKAALLLERAGYSQIETNAWSFRGCPDDRYSTRFAAVGVTGHEVTGVVCSNWFKGSTIRLF